MNTKLDNNNYLKKIRNFIFEFEKNKEAPFILEFGVRQGRSTKMFLEICERNNGSLISIDIDDYANLFNDKNWTFIQCRDDNKVKISPFIKKRIIHEEEVINECLKVKKYEHIEKFIQEVFWRTYWKGWLEGRSEVWEKYKMSLNELVEQHKFGIRKKNYDGALNARTGIDCFDIWVFTQSLENVVC